MAIALLAALSAAPKLLAQTTEVTAPCRMPGWANEVRCGVARRPLDPARPGGAQLDIHYVVVRALARRRLPDPVFMLAGGPGQSAIALAPAVLPLFARLNNRRDIVFVDQRGTGRSAPLDCDDNRLAPLSEPDGLDAQLARLKLCLARLATTAPLTSTDDLKFFTTAIAMQDLDAVRARLGAERINLIGASYGTRAALDYARQFPARVRRSVLDGLAPPDMVLPVSGGTDPQAAFDALLTDCERSPACHRSHPRLREEWAELLASLPQGVLAAHPLTGRTEHFTLDRDRLLGWVRGPLHAPWLAAALPRAIGEAAAGRHAGLLGLSAALSSRRNGRVATGMHFSVICAEDGPLLPPPDPAAAAATMPFVDHAMRLYQRACALWPRGAVPEDFYRLAASSAPALLLSGGLDPATPPRHGERIARALGNKALHVVAPNAGHGLIGIGCVRDVVFRFIDAMDDAAALAIDASCVTDIPRPPAFEPVDPSMSETQHNASGAR